MGIVVGDVSGKGMPAALLMALMQGSLRTLISAGLRGPELITKLNVYLCANTPLDRLITLFYGELDTSTGELCYVNAGHNAPILMRSDRNLDHLHSTALVLGVDNNALFEAKTIRINPGESPVALYRWSFRSFQCKRGRIRGTKNDCVPSGAGKFVLGGSDPQTCE